jgi:hypothetical protein
MIRKRSGRAAVLACASLALLGLAVGASPAAAKTKKKLKTVNAVFSQCQNVALPLGDHVTQLVPFTVPPTPKSARPRGGRVIPFTSAGVRITHSYDADLSIFLVSSTGRVVPLVLNRGGSDNDFGSGGADCGGTLATFTDAASASISTATAPFAGAFKPEVTLGGLNDATGSGTWTMVITDNAENDDGTIHAVSLSLTYQYTVPKKTKK